MNEQRHLIWSNYDLDYEDWRADLEAEYPELSEDERMALMHEINGNYLDDERANLNIQLTYGVSSCVMNTRHGRSVIIGLEETQ